MHAGITSNTNVRRISMEGNIDYRTLDGCGRSKCCLISAARGAAQRDLTSLDRRGLHPQRRGGRSCQYRYRYNNR